MLSRNCATTKTEMVSQSRNSVRHGRIAEDQMDQVAALRVDRREIAEHQLRRLVPADHVPHRVHGVGGVWRQAIHRALQRRGDGGRELRRRRRLEVWPRQPEQVRALHVAEAQGAGEAAEHPHRRLDRPGLLQPGVPGEADAGDHRHLFAQQSASTSPRASRHAGAGRRDACAAVLQELRQVPAPAFVIEGHQHEGGSPNTSNPASIVRTL